MKRIPSQLLFGVLMLTLVMTFYSFLTSPSFFTSRLRPIYDSLAYVQLLALMVGLSMSSLGIYRMLERGIESNKSLASIPLNVGNLIPYVLSKRKHSRVFIVSTLIYALFFSWVTGIIIYQPSVVFSEVYLAEIPSISITSCCGTPLQFPILAVYATEHLGFLIIPLSILILPLMSGLVGLNLALTSFAYENRHGSIGSQSSFAGLGATVGLFTGCPTCAGLLLSSILAGPTAVSTVALATSLSSLQSLLLAISLLILIAAPYLVIRNMSKVFKDGCITSGSSTASKA